MASISDIFDWLNQGAQGDIPGTGGSNSSSQSSVPGSADRNSFWNFNQVAPYNPPGVEDDRVTQAAATPQDYTGALSHDQLDHYNALVQAGIPPSMAHMILTQGGGQLQSSRQPSKPSSQKQGSQQQSGAYSLGHMAGSGLHSLLFGPSSQQSQQDGQSQGHQGLIHMLSNWFLPQSGASDYDTGGLY